MFFIAIVIAAAGALGLAVGTHLQHRAIRESAAPESPPTGMIAGRAFLRPVWLLGMGVIALSTALNVVALGLAPVALIQPIGCLALVTAVVVSARALGVPLRRGLVLGIALTVLAVGVFVGVSAGFALEVRASASAVALLSWLLLCLCLVGVLVCHPRAGHIARVSCAGAMFGAVASAVHVVSVELHTRVAGGYVATTGIDVDGIGTSVVSVPRLWGLVALLAAASAIGMWLVQTAYASGPPETVLAGLTVIDPIAAVAVGAILLGEYAPIPPLALLSLFVSGAFALFGIALIVRHHPCMPQPRGAANTAGTAVPSAAVSRGSAGTVTPRTAGTVSPRAGFTGPPAADTTNPARAAVGAASGNGRG